jgi:hypothetical protein
VVLPEASTRKPTTVRNVQCSVLRLLGVFVHLRDEGYFKEALREWTYLPPRVATAALPTLSHEHDSQANEAAELRAVRRHLALLDRQISVAKRTTQGRRHLLPRLRDRALLETAVVTASRRESLAAMDVSDILPAYVCPWDGTARPAIRLTELKGKRHEEHVIAISEEHHRHIVEYLEYAGIDDKPDHQMWHGQWTYWDTVSGEQLLAAEGSPLYETIAGRERVTRVLPTCEMTPDSMSAILKTLASRCGVNGRQHTAHSLRHLASQTCKTGAKSYLDDHPEIPNYVTPETIAMALMGHEFKKVADMYDELNKTAMKRRCAAIGAAVNWGLLRGEQGAEPGLDEQRILAAKQSLQETQAEMTASERRSADLEARLARIEDGVHPAQSKIAEHRERRSAMRAELMARLAAGTVSDLDFRKNEIERQEIEDAVDHLRDELVLEERRLNRDVRVEAGLQRNLDRRISECLAELDAAVAARVPLPDLVEGYDIDARLAELLDGVPAFEHGGEGAEPQLVREKLTLQEYASVMGIPLSSLRRQLVKSLASRDGFAFAGGRNNPRQPFGQPVEQVLEVHGPHSRYVVFSKLDLSWYHPDQIREMKRLLSTAA